MTAVHLVSYLIFPPSHPHSKRKLIPIRRPGVASPTCSGANTIVSKLGALIVLQSILNQEIDIDAIPQQQSAYGVVPGGSIDMRGISRRPTTAIAMREKIMEVAMEEEELTAEQEEERERVLRELMRG